MTKLFKNYLYNTIYQLFIICTPLVTAPYLARVLKANSLGVSSYVTSLGSIVSTIGLLGIYNYGCRQIAYVRDDKKKITQSFIEIMLVRVLLLIVTTIVYVYFCYTSQYNLYFTIYYIWILANFLDVTWLYIGLEDMGVATFKNFIAKLFSVVGIFAFIKSEDDLWKYIMLLALPTLLSNISVYFQLKKHINFSYLEPLQWRCHLRKSISLFLPQIATTIYLQVDKVMIELLTGNSTQVAFYDYAEKIVKIPLALITAISIVMMPRIANEFSKGNHKNVTRYMVYTLKIIGLICLPIMFGIACLSPNLIPWYLGEDFIPVIYAIIIISPIIITNSFTSASGNLYFTAIGQTKILTFSYTCAAIVNLIINFILIPKIGFYGAAIGTLGAEFSTLIVQYYLLNKKIDIKFLIPILFKYSIYSVLMSIPVIMTGVVLNNSIFTTIFQIIVGCLTYIFLLFIFKDELLYKFIFKLSSLYRNKINCGN